MSDDDIISRRIRGESVREIAKRKRTTQDRVAREINRWADRSINDTLRKTTLALELSRLDAMTKIFYEKALAGDTASGHLVNKIIERRCVMLGLHTPTLHTLQVLHQVQPAQSSTERLEQALENLLEDKRRQQEAEPAPTIDGKVEPTTH